jgi:hypothetical protein
LNVLQQGLVECGEIVHRLFEKAVGKVTSVVTQVVDVDDETVLVEAEHVADVGLVVVKIGLRVEELFEDTRSVAHKVILGNRLVKERHDGDERRIAVDGTGGVEAKALQMSYATACPAKRSALNATDAHIHVPVSVA